MKNMTFKIDAETKEHLASMAKSHRRTSSDFLRLLLEQEWERHIKQYPTAGALIASGDWNKEYPQGTE